MDLPALRPPSSRGRNAPLPPSKLATCPLQGPQGINMRKSPSGSRRYSALLLRQAFPRRWERLTLRERAVRKRAKYPGISAHDARALHPAPSASDARPVSGRVSLTTGSGFVSLFVRCVFPLIPTHRSISWRTRYRGWRRSVSYP